MALTEAGAAFSPGCEAMLLQTQQAEQRLAELRDTLVGELRIATTVGIGGRLLAETMAPLRLHALTLEGAMSEKNRQALRYLRDYFRRHTEKTLASGANGVFN